MRRMHRTMQRIDLSYRNEIIYPYGETLRGRTKMRTLNILSGLALTAASLFIAESANAEKLNLSGETVTILVPFSEGGGSDTLARFLQPFLQEALPGNPSVVVLNKPGGGSVTGVNAWIGSAPTDGTSILVGSSSTWVPYVFGSETVEYNPNDMRAVVGFPRVSAFYTNPELTGVAGTSDAAGVNELRSKRLMMGANAPLSLDLGDMLALHLLEIPHRAVFGLSTGEQRRAFLSGEVSANSDSLSAYNDIAANEGPGRVSPLFVIGGVDADGHAMRIAAHPDVKTVAELYEEVHGSLPSGPEYNAFQVMHYLRTNLAKAIMLPPSTPDEIVDAYIAAFRSLEENPAYIEGMLNEIEAQSFVYGDDLAASFAGASGFGAEERAAAEAYMREIHGVSLN